MSQRIVHHPDGSRNYLKQAKSYFSFVICISILCTACNNRSTEAKSTASQSTSQATTLSASPYPSPHSSEQDTPSLIKPDVTSSSTIAPSTQTIVPTPTAANTPTFTPISPFLLTTGISLEGPLMAYRVNDDQGFHIALVDLDTKVIREIRNDLVNYPLELQWFGDGCLLFVRGRLIDLQGNIIWEIPLITERGWDLWSFGDSRLSPDKKWLIVPLYSGSANYDSSEFFNLEAVDLTNLSPPIPLTINGGAHASATWSPDGTLVAFSDYDSQGILQVFQATPDGQNIEQLTFHAESVNGISSIVWKPDGSQIAYAGINRFPSGEPKESWIDIINLDSHEIIHVQPSQLSFVGQIWWSPDTERLAFTGEGLLTLNENDSLSESQIHWVDSTSGQVLNSFYAHDAPFGWLVNPHPVKNIDSFFWGSKDGYYLLNGLNNAYTYLGDFELERWTE